MEVEVITKNPQPQQPQKIQQPQTTQTVQIIQTTQTPQKVMTVITTTKKHIQPQNVTVTTLVHTEQLTTVSQLT